jgi:iron complex outermembrane receptor protein
MSMFRFLGILFFFAPIFSAKAQQDTLTQKLGEVLIQENRIQLPFSKQNRTIVLLDRRHLDLSPAKSLNEVLSFVSGVDVRQRGVAGVQADVGIRGGSFEQTLLLLNGIKLSDPQTGHHLMNIPIPLLGIDRVEVLKGPASRIFGQNAFTGAINVITRLAEAPSLRLQSYGGSFGSSGISVAGALPIGNYRQQLSFSSDGSDGHWYNSDYKVRNLFYEGGAQVHPAHEIRGMLGYTDRSFGANGFYTSSFPDQWESIQTRLAAVSHTYKKEKFQLLSRAYWRQNEDEFRLKRKEPAFFQNNHTSTVSAVETHGTYSSSLGVTGLGLEFRQEGIVSSNLGDHSRSLFGLFAEQLISVGKKGEIRGGLYSTYYSEYGLKHFPGVELGYQVSPALRLFSGAGSSFRIPTYTDLYYRGPTNVGNPDLVPEEAFSVELGAKWAKPTWRAEVVLFNRASQNLIEWSRTTTKEPWKPQNFTSVNFQGLETSFTYQLATGSQLVRIKEVQLSYNYIDASLEPVPGLETRYALTALRHQLLGGFLVGLGKKVEWNSKVRYVERISLDPYLVVDTRVDFNRLGKLGFFGELSNLTDTDYVEAGTVQMPGRWFRAGLVVNLE